MSELDLSKLEDLKTRVHNKLEQTSLYQFKGTVSKLLGLTVEVKLPGLKIGDLCYIETNTGELKPAEVSAFKGEVAQLLLLLDGNGIGQGSLVTSTGQPITIPVGDFLLGRLIDPMGQPMDGKPMDISGATWRSIEGPPPGPFERPIIQEIFSTGVRAIDSCLTMGCGQRLGLFAGSGVGKSTLLGMIARNSDADVNVVALIGERGREVKEFIEDSLGEEGMRKSVLVCATGDKPPLIRQTSPMQNKITGTIMNYSPFGSSIRFEPCKRGTGCCVFPYYNKLEAGCREKNYEQFVAFYNSMQLLLRLFRRCLEQTLRHTKR